MKKIIFILTGLLISLSLFSSSTYKLTLKFYAKAWGKLLFIIPYEAYGSVKADLLLNAHNRKEGSTLFKFNKLNSPGYYIQTVKFIPEEIHARVVSNTIKGGYAYGKKILKKICKENEFICDSISENKKKSLPFLLKKKNEDIFSFIRNSDGKIPDNKINYNIEPFYAWPSKSEFGVPSYKMLSAALCFFNLRYRRRLIEGNKYKIVNLSLNHCMNKVLKYAIPTIKKFVKLRQERLFDVYFYKKQTQKRIIYIGSAFPNVEIWGNYKITEFYRKIIFQKNSKKIVFDKINLKVFNKKNKGGEAEIILNKIN